MLLNRNPSWRQGSRPQPVDQAQDLCEQGSRDGGLGGDDDETDAIVGGVSYALGPGITASGSILYGNFEDEAGAEGKATMGIVGLSVSF